MSAKHGGDSHKGNSSGSGGMGLAIMTTALNYSGVADELETVLNDIKSWKAALPENSTIQSENILEGIISDLRLLSNNSGGVEAVVSGLRSELGKEVAKRERLEREVKALKAEVTQLTAKQADGQAVDFLAVVMTMLKTFIFRVELNTGGYSADFKRANDREIIDALFPEQIDLLVDSLDEQIYKTKLLKLNVEALSFVGRLGLDPQFIFDLNNLVQVRNQNAHAMNNKRFKESTYVEGKLDDFSTLIDKLPAESALVSIKEPLKKMVTDLKLLHQKYLRIGNYPII
jgi:hypothetical protein